MTKSPGQIAYEAECAVWPYYYDGSPRTQWADLHPAIQANWDKNPTPRENPPWGRKVPLLTRLQGVD